jgi:integrase
MVISLWTRDRKDLPHRYATVHAEVERLFAEAKTGAGISDDLLFEAAVRSLRSQGLPTFESAKEWTAGDRSDAVDLVLQRAGIQSLDDLEEAFETATGAERDRLRQVSTQIAITQGSVGRPKPTLTYCLQLMLTDKARGRDTEQGDWVRYKRERERIINDVVSQIGNKTITTVTRTDARLILSYLEASGYAGGSIKKQLAFIKALFDFGFQEYEVVAANPFRSLRIAVDQADDEQGVSFTYAEVRTMLGSVASINDELRDIVRLLACTGARLSEISGLQRGDVDCDAATIQLQYNKIRRLKNRQSVRLIPVVDEEALSALAQRMADSTSHRSDDPLFPRYGREAGGNSASAALGKWLSRIGLRDLTAKEVKTTHSLRHTFKDALREASIHRDIANMLQGHTAGDAASAYGTSELIDAKRLAASKAWSIIIGAS